MGSRFSHTTYRKVLLGFSRQLCMDGYSKLTFSHVYAFDKDTANGVNPLQLTFQIALSIRPCHVAAFCKADFECLSADANLVMNYCHR